MKKAQSLDDFSSIKEKIIFNSRDMEQFIGTLMKGGTGEFSREAFNKFLSKNNFAKIAWSFTHKNGTVDKFKSGRVMEVKVYPNSKGTVVWNGHALPTDMPFLFWEDLYNQCCAYQGRKEYASQKQLEGFSKMAETIGTSIPETYE